MWTEEKRKEGEAEMIMDFDNGVNGLGFYLTSMFVRIWDEGLVRGTCRQAFLINP